MNNPKQTFWFPPDLEEGANPVGNPEKVELNGISARAVRVTSKSVEILAGKMRERKLRLGKLPIVRIIDALHRTSLAWLEEEWEVRKETVRAISTLTGTSPEMVSLSIRHEMESSLGPHLEAAVRNEIGNPGYLDRFTANPLLGGKTFAMGPDLVGGIVSSNIPALPHLTVMRSLLVKAPCIVKTSMSEPFFLPAYAESLMEIDPDVGRAVAVVSFAGKDRDVLKAFLGNIDFLIAYGSLQAIDDIRMLKPPDLDALFHGHKLGFGLVTKEMLSAEQREKLAGSIAYDTILFDQDACLSPHIIFVEGSFGECVLLAEKIAGSMEQFAVQYPPPVKRLSSRLAVREYLDAMLMSSDRDLKLFPAGTMENGAVIVQSLEKFEPSHLGRVIRIAPVDKIESAIRIVRPLAGLLQNAFLAAENSRKEDIAMQLAELGVSRLCEPGRMGAPSMMWHHDGKCCIGSMLRFCDMETGGGEDMESS